MKVEDEEETTVISRDLGSTASWFGIYVGWLGHNNIGDDALLDIFISILQGKSNDSVPTKHFELTPKQCRKVMQGGEGAPVFVSMGGGSTIRDNYMDSANHYLASFPNALPLMFGSGWDDYEVKLTVDEGTRLFQDLAKNEQQHQIKKILSRIVTKEHKYKILHDTTFWKRPWIGGIRGPITQRLIKHCLADQHNDAVVSPPYIMYDPGMLASLLLKKTTQSFPFAEKISSVRSKQMEETEIESSSQVTMRHAVLNVGLSPIHPVYGGRGEKASHHAVQVFGKLACAMAMDGVNVIFVSAWQADLEANEEAASLGRRNIIKTTTARKKVGTIQVLSKIPTLLQLLSIIKEVEVVIGMRLHMSVFAFSMQIPAVIVAYRLKHFDYAASVNLVDNVIAMNETTNHKHLYKLAKQILRNPAAGIANMVGHNEGAKHMWDSFREDLIERSGRTSIDGFGKICSGICKNDNFAVVGECAGILKKKK